MQNYEAALFKRTKKRAFFCNEVHTLRVTSKYLVTKTYYLLVSFFFLIFSLIEGRLKFDIYIFSF